MLVRSIVNVVVLSVWVISQSVFAFAHAPMALESKHDHGAASQMECSGSGHAGKHQQAHGHYQHGDQSDQHHKNSTVDKCCEAACSVASGVNQVNVCGMKLSRIFGHGPSDTLRATLQGLPTPPPNPII